MTSHLSAIGRGSASEESTVARSKIFGTDRTGGLEMDNMDNYYMDLGHNEGYEGIDAIASSRKGWT